MGDRSSRSQEMLLQLFLMNVVHLVFRVWYGMVDVCDGYLAAEASGSRGGGRRSIKIVVAI